MLLYNYSKEITKLQRYGSGFTLIELIIVIAIIGILAAVVLAVINPIEQLAKSRDTGRRSSVSQLGNAVEAYYIGTGTYPVASAAWQNLIGPSGTNDLKQVLTAPAGVSANCTTNAQGNFCYTTTGTTDAAVWTISESKTEKTKCGVNTAIVIWVASQGKTGIGCIAAASTVPAYSITILN